MTMAYSSGKKKDVLIFVFLKLKKIKHESDVLLLETAFFVMTQVGKPNDISPPYTEQKFPGFLRFMQVLSTANITNSYPIKRPQLFFGGLSFLSIKLYGRRYNARSEVSRRTGKRSTTSSYLTILKKFLSVSRSNRIWNLPRWTFILLDEYTSLIIWTSQFFVFWFLISSIRYNACDTNT